MIHTNTSGSRSGLKVSASWDAGREPSPTLATLEFKGHVPTWEYWQETDSEGHVSAWWCWHQWRPKVFNLGWDTTTPVTWLAVLVLCLSWALRGPNGRRIYAQTCANPQGHAPRAAQYVHSQGPPEASTWASGLQQEHVASMRRGSRWMFVFAFKSDALHGNFSRARTLLTAVGIGHEPVRLSRLPNRRLRRVRGHQFNPTFLY